jgi:class 3 adenylate cyclase
VASPPTGTLTFLFTDIEGSTRLWEHDAQAMQAALTRHDEILQWAMGSRGGYVFETVGDAFCAAFAARLSFLPQRHSTAPPSPERYDNRYEEMFQESNCPHQLPRDKGVAPRCGGGEYKSSHQLQYRW